MNYADFVKTNRMVSVQEDIDRAATPGVLEIGTVGMASIIYRKVLQKPCGSVSGNSLTLFGFPVSTNALLSGETLESRITDGDGIPVVIEITTGEAPTVLGDPIPEIIVQNSDVNAGQQATIQQITWSHG